MSTDKLALQTKDSKASLDDRTLSVHAVWEAEHAHLTRTGANGRLFRLLDEIAGAYTQRERNTRHSLADQVNDAWRDAQIDIQKSRTLQATKDAERAALRRTLLRLRGQSEVSERDQQRFRIILASRHARSLDGRLALPGNEKRRDERRVESQRKQTLGKTTI